jgi:hypothetical protein
VNEITTTPAAEQAKAGKAKARQIVAAHMEIGRCAALLDMSPRYVKGRLKAGEMTGFRLGNRIVVECESILTFLENRRMGPMEEA